jgi:hypothetical protein
MTGRDECIKYEDINSDDFGYYWHSSFVVWTDPDDPSRLIVVTPRLLGRDVSLQRGSSARDNLRVPLRTFYSDAILEFPKMGYVDLQDKVPVYMSVRAGRGRRKSITNELVEMIIPITPPDDSYLCSEQRIIHRDLSEATYRAALAGPDESPALHDRVAALTAHRDRTNRAHQVLTHGPSLRPCVANFEQVLNNDYTSMDEAMGILLDDQVTRLGVALSKDLALFRGGSRVSLPLFFRTARIGTVRKDGSIVPHGRHGAVVVEFVKSQLL